MIAVFDDCHVECFFNGCTSGSKANLAACLVLPHVGTFMQGEPIIIIGIQSSIYDYILCSLSRRHDAKNNRGIYHGNDVTGIDCRLLCSS